jgi:hypothetical protein
VLHAENLSSSNFDANAIEGLCAEAVSLPKPSLCLQNGVEMLVRSSLVKQRIQLKYWTLVGNFSTSIFQYILMPIMLVECSGYWLLPHGPGLRLLRGFPRRVELSKGERVKTRSIYHLCCMSCLLWI